MGPKGVSPEDYQSGRQSRIPRLIVKSVTDEIEQTVQSAPYKEDKRRYSILEA